MIVDLGKVLESLGGKVIGDVGAPLGLSAEMSVKVAQSLAANASKGAGAVKAAAEETGVAQDVVQNMSAKLYDKGKEMLLEQSGAAEHIEKAKENAMAAMKGAAGGLLGGLFGKK